MTKKIREIAKKQRENKIKSICDRFSINNSIKFLIRDFGFTKKTAIDRYNSYSK